MAVTASAADNFPSPTLKIERDNTPLHVVAYTVSADSLYNLNPSYIQFGSAGQTDGTITVNPSQTYQDIDGFGFAITSTAAYNLLKMSEVDRKGFLTKVFSPAYGYGCSYVRIPIGTSDYALSEYTCCDTPGIENFALTDEETKYIIPVMKEILAINPDVKVMSAPWTAPRWMKTNGNWTSGELKTEYYQDYATYFVKWIQAFAANGINITAITPQNEPLNRGNSASMYMGWEQQRDFIKQALGPKLRQAGLSTQIYLFDHNYNYDNDASQSHYPLKVYEDADAAQYITGAAYHNYGGSASEMTYVHNQRPDKQLLFTEWTAGTWSHDVSIREVMDDTRNLVFDVVKNWGRGAMVWNLMLDSKRGPYRPGGCSTGNGAVDLMDDNRTIRYNSFYYTMCLAASAVRPGAKRVEASGSADNINYVAFKNPDGFGLVITNKADKARSLTVTDGSHTFVVSLPAKSAVSCRW